VGVRLTTLGATLVTLRSNVAVAVFSPSVAVRVTVVVAGPSSNALDQVQIPAVEVVTWPVDADTVTGASVEEV
jgi:hypothetical protein